LTEDLRTTDTMVTTSKDVITELCL